jgi:glycerophosphoryl diester phosphodiesterase
VHIPDIIAHRGASRECRENTLAAFALAIEQGADGIELDVHGSADGHLVVHHDPIVPPSTGEGARPRAIREMTSEELRLVRLEGGQPLPFLADVFELVAGRVTVYVEVKAPGVEQAVAAILDRYPDSSAAVHAFDHRIPVQVRALRPGTPIGVLSDLYPIDLSALLRPAAPTALWQHASLIDEALVRTAHADGIQVMAWTENDPAHARMLASWGVDGLCTDVPATLRAAFTRG